MNRYKPLEDRRILLNLCKVIKISPKRIKKDDCDYYTIYGTKGYIQTWGDNEGKSFLVRPYTHTKRKWGLTKRKLSFMEVTQDGDEEGILKFTLPLEEHQANLIRKALGIRKSKELTEEEKLILHARLEGFKTPIT
jgi:hypothetical protein